MAEEKVESGKAVTWGPVRKLAQDISELYSSKKIFELKEEDPTYLENTTISTKSTRFSDINARTCNISSAERGCVYLSRDITAPFRIDKLGKTEDFEKKALAFEFAYDPKKYNDYLNGNAKPVLTTQYLLYYESVANDQTFTAENVVYTTEHIATELSDSPSKITHLDRCTITNLIESDRSKIRKFWDYGNNYYGDSYYADSTEIAGELYMLIEGSSNPDCCYIARVALAGLNNNGNGNSEGVAGKPAPWVTEGDGYVGSSEIPTKFVTSDDIPWMSTKSYAVTLTGISMDKTYKSNSKPGTNTTKGFKPETPKAGDATYPPPPIGCSTEFIWPTIGTEGGGSNSFYSTGIFSTYIDWADWRDEYRNLLIPDDLAHAKANTKTTSPEDKYFPCYLGEGRTGDKPETYYYLSTTKSIETPYQRWVKVNATTYVRLVPMEFTIAENQPEKAYLTVPVTVVKILKPKSYQTAIRKRWYDMMYYTLRNIAGYKYRKYIDGIGDCYRVIGVTWDNGLKTNNTIYTNPCINNLYDDDPDNDDCLCARCSYERWKILNLGGEKSLADEDNSYVTPFIGTELEFRTYSDAGNNAAQMWTWEEDRRQVIDDYKTDVEDYDILFPELYFERLLCYKNKELYSTYAGGFVNIEKENKPCECLICYYTSYQTSPINLPWEGGGDNETCDSAETASEASEITIYKTHAYTFKVLQDLTTFITEYKLYEDEPRDISALEMGYCYCPATMGDTMGITLMNRTVSHYACTDPFNEYCATETLNLELPEIPAYYNTLSKNEKAMLEPTGIECLLEIAKELKPFGYSAYIWKAVDIGGYKENRKDIKIEFVHYNPARVCSSGTMMAPELLENYYPEEGDDPLYMYNPNCYTAKPATSPYATATITDHPCSTDSPCTVTPTSICPNAEGSIRAFNYNRKYEEVWEEVLYWSNEKWVGCSKTPDPAAMSSAKIWHRDNEYTSVGTIEIYVAPFFNPDSADHKYQAKFLGSCNLQRELPPSEDNPISGAEEALKYAVVPYACGDVLPVSESMNSVAQKVIVNSDKSFTADATNVITFNIEDANQPTDIRDKDDPYKNFVKVDIIIPSELLIDESPDEAQTAHTYGIDLRQKYIILAVRASHTNINSGLVSSNGQVSNNTPDDVKKWATTYAGACRYDEFRTAYKFSLYSEETS